MKMTMIRILVLLFLIECRLIAGPVQISFLSDSATINSAAKILLAKGCSKSSVDSFLKVASWYNKTPSDLNLAKFPQKTNGFYTFQSMTDLVSTLDHPLIYTHHQPTLNCFDFASLLLGNRIKFTLSPETIAGPFLVPHPMTNDTVVLAIAATPKNAFELACPVWWAEASKDFFNPLAQDNRMFFLAAFDTCTILPAEIEESNLPTILLKSLKMSWDRCGVKFPRKPQIVLFNSVSYNVLWKHYNSVGAHVGLLFKDGGHYLYFEKAGAWGPYVMLKFQDLPDLFTWYMAAINPFNVKENIVFATFNDEAIYRVN